MNVAFARRAERWSVRSGGGPLRIGFFVERMATNVASIWYRALYPAVAIEERGHRVQVFDIAPSPRELAGLDALIIVKGLSPKALSTALQASRCNVPVYLDLCDDVFVPDYGAGEGMEAAYFRACATLAQGVVTTGPVMAETLAVELGPRVDIWVIPDPVETAEFNARVAARLPIWARLNDRRRFERNAAQAVTRLLNRTAAGLRRGLGRPLAASTSIRLWVKRTAHFATVVIRHAIYWAGVTRRHIRVALRDMRIAGRTKRSQP